MPIYEYHCSACGADFEKLVFSTTALVPCDRCGSERTEKRLSRFGMGRSSSSSSDGSGSSGCGGCSSSSCAGCH